MGKFKTAALLALVFLCTYAMAQTVMLSGATETGAGSAVAPTFSGSKQFQAVATTTAGTGTAVITIECSVNGTHWNSTPIGTITLTATTTGAADGVTTTDRCLQLRANVTTITGTGTAATVYMAQ